MIRIISSTDAVELLTRKTVRLEEAEAVVRPIIEEVRTRGDEALLRYAREFDQFDRERPLVPQRELDEAAANLLSPLLDAVRIAAANIRTVAQRQLPQPWQIEIADGLKIGQTVRPLETVCAYIPSSRYPLLSTLMMTVIPAQVAGVRNICVTTPKPAAEILGTASLLGNQSVYLLGGAHAIAAFAFGTESIPRADLIVGPGNIYVAAAKKLLAGEVSIDFVAGPTETVIIASEGDPKWIAADMLAQAEHDTDASAILLTTSASLAYEVATQIETQLATVPTSSTAGASIDANSAIVLVSSTDEAIDLSNRWAPEHVSVCGETLVDKIRNAGSIFIGPTSAEAAGDYATGANHVLPTSGAARRRGGLSATDFVKVISTQQITPEALRTLVPTITTLARAEGLEGHARSVEVRTCG